MQCEVDKVISLFLTSDHAALYAKYRLKPPQRIFETILKFLGQQVTPPFGHALDVGCGNGQSTDMLAEHFEQVTGLDISKAQIDEAIKRNKFEKISYKVGTATNLPFDRDQLQLITASQCHHWLDLPAFYEDVKRVLVSKGVLCIYFHQLPFLIDETNRNSDLENAINHVYSVELKDFGDQRRTIVDRGLEDFHFPFEDVLIEYFSMDTVLPVSDISGLIRSWSPYQSLLISDPVRATKVVDDFQEKVLVAIGSEDGNPDKVTVTIRHPYCLIMGRNV